MVPLSGNQGFVEIRSERVGAEARSASRQSQNAQLIAYFYGSDAVTPLSPAPTEVSVKAGTADQSAVIGLVPDSKDASRFISQPAPIRDGFQGELHAKIHGETCNASFLLR
jgi:hypothetical protein